MRVAVIGLGAVGGAAARFAAEDGHDVVGFERHELGHDRGSSHGESRIFRFAYADARYARMMRDAMPLWERLEQLSGESLMVRCGGLLLGPREHHGVAEVLETFERERVTHDVLGPDAAAERFPALRLASGEVAVWHEDAGFLRATRCVLANARLARAAGAELREGCRVDGIAQRGNEVIVATDAGEQAFDRAIVTAGAWLPRLLPEASLPLTVTKQQVIYLRIRRDPAHFDPSRLPVWIDAATNDYGFPSDGRVDGVKVASHDLGPRFDPDTATRDVDLDAERGLVDRVTERFPGLSSEVTGSLACLYTSTPDEHFLFGTVPGMPRVAYASACSGHGFKFSILSGWRLARMTPGQD